MPGYKRKRLGSGSGRYFKPYAQRKVRGGARANFASRRGTGSMALLRGVAPPRMKRTFNYCDKRSLDGGAGGTVSSLFFSANSLYDPDRSGVGHQPMGFDQLMPLYDHFVVTKARINVMAAVASEAVGRAANQVLAINIRDTNTTTTNIAESIEAGRAVWTLMTQGTGARGAVSLSHEVDVRKFLGRQSLLSDPQMKGSIIGNPTEEVFFEISVANLDGDDPPLVDMLVTIQYEAYLIEPSKLIGS